VVTAAAMALIVSFGDERYPRPTRPTPRRRLAAGLVQLRLGVVTVGAQVGGGPSRGVKRAGLQRGTSTQATAVHSAFALTLSPPSPVHAPSISPNIPHRVQAGRRAASRPIVEGSSASVASADAAPTPKKRGVAAAREPQPNASLHCPLYCNGELCLRPAWGAWGCRCSVRQSV
jgi:hypothetical protein